MEVVKFSLIAKQDLKIGTGTFEVTLADGKVVQLDEIDIGALLELTPIKTYATSAALPSPSLAGQLARVAADSRLYISDGSTWAVVTVTHTHVFGDITSGIVAVANGGTGATFATTAQGALWYFSGTGTLAALAAGSLGAFLEAKGAAANPVWLGPLTNGQIFVGSSGSDPVAASITGSNGVTVTGGAGTIALSGGRKTIRKTADEIVNNSATLQNDDHLVMAVGANEIWHFTFVLFTTAGANNTPDIKLLLTVPAGATGFWGIHGLTTAATGVDGNGIMAGAASLDGLTTLSAGVVASANSMIIIEGTIVNGGNAGNLQLQWAQNVATAVDTTVKAGSYGVMVLGS